MNRREIDGYLKNRDFEQLFINQGFDFANIRPLTIAVGEREFVVRVDYHKRGFAVCACEDEGVIDLSKAEKKKLHKELTRYHYEHLLILCGKDGSGRERQQWLVNIRPQNRPVREVVVEWREGNATQELHEKLAGLIFPLEEEEGLTIVDVVRRVQEAFVTNSERVTRRFYQRFKDELGAFGKFIKGIRNSVDKEQYAALMLNRLMFIYFIQKKEFLDGDVNYLQNRLEQVQQQYGENQFHNRFYREFLRRLFKDGLDTPATERSSEINALLGKVPYLNGGLFDAHKLEIENTEINIPDAAFKKLFAFFDMYKWHLDDRRTAKENEINPDVLGYIFEKYINERAKMGAYYTQEDITEYIAKNTILPYLLQQAQSGDSNAFAPDVGIWQFLRENPDGYIYDSIKYGCDISDSDIPEHIRIGLDNSADDLIARRKRWNEKASLEFALVNETWREVIARRERYRALKQKMLNGEITTIDALITHNIDIIRFVSDVLNNYAGSDFIDVFFRAIAGVRHSWKEGTTLQPRRGISILDPACGSGAFLFAALNILQPLYSICVSRMVEFVEIDDQRTQRSGGRRQHPLYRKVLAEIKLHDDNAEYWIYKTIILENLYGVDLMQDAAEIAKLRLFLKLAAVAKYDPSKSNLGLEPLPDIDYNIRAGNSLVGFSSMAQFENTVRNKLNIDHELVTTIHNQVETVKLAKRAFIDAQENTDGSYTEIKQRLGNRLGELNENLNQYLVESEYFIGKSVNGYQAWKASHLPFHWLAEFNEIMGDNGGFDVIIGNPPYVACRTIPYKLHQYKSHPDLYACFAEMTNSLLNSNGYTGMIVPLSLSFSRDFSRCRNLLFSDYAYSWFSSYGKRPSGLFHSDAQIRNTIYIANKQDENTTTANVCYTGKLNRWHSTYRPHLLKTIEFFTFKPALWKYQIPKLNTAELINGFEQLIKKKRILRYYTTSVKDSNILLFAAIAYNWLTVVETMPPCYHGDKVIPNTGTGEIKFKDKEIYSIASLLANGKLMFIFWLAIGDDFHLTGETLLQFPVSLNDLSLKDRKKLLKIYAELLEFLPRTVQYQKNAGKLIGKYNLNKCRHITDKSDKIFAEFLGIADLWEDIELYCSQTVKIDERINDESK